MKQKFNIIITEITFAFFWIIIGITALIFFFMKGSLDLWGMIQFMFVFGFTIPLGVSSLLNIFYLKGKHDGAEIGVKNEF